MNWNTSGPLIGLGAVLLIAIIWVVASRRSQGPMQMQMVSSEDDPTLQEISKQRTALISEIIAVFSAVWCPEKEKLFVQSSNTDWNRNIVTVIYENKMARLYCDWEGGTVNVAVCFKYDSQEKTHSMRLSVKKGLPKLNKLQTALTKWTLELEPPEKGPAAVNPMMLAVCVGLAEKMVARCTDPENLQWLFSYWTSVIPNMETTEDLSRPEVATFIRLTSILQRYWPEQFKEYIANATKTEQKDPE